MAMKVCYTTVNGQVIAENRNGVRSLYLPDSLGSTAALIDNTQTLTDTFEYWPYGEVRTRTGTNTTALRFVGTRGYYSDSSSKTYVRARTFDTQKGRWMTIDPIGFGGGDSNLYRYVRNRSTTWIDPTGLNPACIACGICIGGVALIALAACASDPYGWGHCLTCWCRSNPILCGILVGTCSVACLLCLPVLAPIVGRIGVIIGRIGTIGVGVGSGLPAYAATGSGGNSCDGDDDDNDNKPKPPCRKDCARDCSFTCARYQLPQLDATAFGICMRGCMFNCLGGRGAIYR